ncbi:dynein regulatory complex protein 1 [Lycorma delicatula]|uniref:dynein regulatory complex protein 1 n=1 Tax=Lycorma delicatula TaxID=130591 RepID=UPI003F5136BE
MSFIDKDLGNTNDDILEPQVTSSDPAERKLARRLRIRRRLNAAKKRLVCDEITDEEDQVVESPITAVDLQVTASNVIIYDAVDQGTEAVTNVQVAGNAYEVHRRENETAFRKARIEHLTLESMSAEKKFDSITAKWKEISSYNDPLNLYEETLKQKEKCKELLAMKDAVIQRLQNELKNAEVRFIKDQEKQTSDINLLVSRINEQIRVMRKVVRAQLTLIETAIETEDKELVDNFSKKWENLNRQREKDQEFNLQQRMINVENHYKNMERIMIDHQEKYLSIKISLELSIQKLQQEVEDIKAICLLNKEKIDYNYQVLKKRDDENLLIKSQQKRRINKLQDIATKLRKQIKQVTENSNLEIKRLRGDVESLHTKINDVQKKSKLFSSVNEVKFQEVWKFNKEKIHVLITKIMTTDNLVYDQILGLPWMPPESYVKYLNFDKKGSEQLSFDEYRKSLSGEMPETRKSETIKKDEKKPQKLPMENAVQSFVKKLLSLIADSTGFIVEDRLQELLAPYTLPQKTLVYLDNIFTALGLKHHHDIELLTKVLEPYVDCLTCSQKAAAASLEDSLIAASHKAADVDRVEWSSEVGVLTRISDMVSNQLDMVQTVIREISYQTPDFDKTSSDEQLSLSIESGTLESFSSIDTSLDLPGASDIRLDTGGKAEDDIDSRASQGGSDHRPREQKYFEEQKLEGQDSVEQRDRYLAQPRVNCKDPSHRLTIEPLCVVKALKEFILHMKNEDEVCKVPLTLEEELARTDSKDYFAKVNAELLIDYNSIFTPKQEKLWDALLLGLYKYHELLQDRHMINLQIKKLKIQNSDLKRLLRNYAIPAGKKEDELIPLVDEDEDVDYLSISNIPHPDDNISHPDDDVPHADDSILSYLSDIFSIN